MCLGVFLLGFFLPGTLCDIWTWMTCFLSSVGGFFQLSSLQIIFQALSLCLLLLGPLQCEYWCTKCCPKSLQGFLMSFSFLFSTFSFAALISTVLSSRSLSLSSASVTLLLIPSNMLLFFHQIFQVLGKHSLHLLNLCLQSFF